MIKYRIWYIDNICQSKPHWHPDFPPSSDLNNAFTFREAKHIKYPENEYEVKEYIININK